MVLNSVSGQSPRKVSPTLKIRWMAILWFAITLLGATPGGLDALVITEFSPPMGPGLGGFVVPQVQTPVQTPQPNNDNSAGTSANQIRLPGVVQAKPFGALGPIDIVFSLRVSGGTTEYSISEAVLNESGVAWGDFHFELGLGTGDDFAPFHKIVFIRPTILPGFDTPDRDPGPTSSVFARVEHADDSISWSGGRVPPGGTVDFSLSVDVPDDPLGSLGQFTLRQLPTAVPEPTPVLLLGSWLAALGAMASSRCRRG